MKGPGRIHQSHDLTTTTTRTPTMSGHLPTALTPRLLDTLRSQPGLPGDVWYAIVATTLCILNRPEDIQGVYRHAVAADAGAGPGAGTADAVADHARQLRIARRLREALLKTSAIGGLPKVSKKKQRQAKASRYERANHDARAWRDAHAPPPNPSSCSSPEARFCPRPVLSCPFVP